MAIPIIERSEVKDSDSDGLTDLKEGILGTNTDILDTDFDGLNDGIDDSPLISFSFENDEIKNFLCKSDYHFKNE